MYGKIKEEAFFLHYANSHNLCSFPSFTLHSTLWHTQSSGFCGAMDCHLHVEIKTTLPHVKWKFKFLNSLAKSELCRNDLSYVEWSGGIKVTITANLFSHSKTDIIWVCGWAYKKGEAQLFFSYDFVAFLAKKESFQRVKKLSWNDKNYEIFFLLVYFSIPNTLFCRRGEERGAKKGKFLCAPDFLSESQLIYSRIFKSNLKFSFLSRDWN